MNFKSFETLVVDMREMSGRQDAENLAPGGERDLKAALTNWCNSVEADELSGCADHTAAFNSIASLFVRGNPPKTPIVIPEHFADLQGCMQEYLTRYSLRPVANQVFEEVKLHVPGTNLLLVAGQSERNYWNELSSVFNRFYSQGFSIIEALHPEHPMGRKPFGDDLDKAKINPIFKRRYEIFEFLAHS